MEEYMQAKWIFDPPPPSGAARGGVAASLVLTADLDTFVREILQNSKDQRVGEQPALVKFSLIQLEGDRKQRFLQSLGWDELEEHIKGASQGGAVMARRLYRSLAEMAETTLLLMRVDDRGTHGLQGEEDSRGTNFNSLCRDILTTAEETPGRGGSHGIGKSVLWNLSSISTVLFSSRIDGNPRAGFRLFGRSDLPYHSAYREKWDGPGWFGKPEEIRPQFYRAVSVWDATAENIARELYLLRDLAVGTGTSILVVGFREPKQETRRPPEEIADDIMKAAIRWFWPSLYSKNPPLEVTAEVLYNNGEVYRSTVNELPEVMPFIQAMKAREEDLVLRAHNPGQVAHEILDFKIPAKLPYPDRPAELEKNARFEVRITRGSQNNRQNQVAFIRGFGMVVQYRQMAAPLDDLPFYGILKGGIAVDDSESSKSLEKFLTAAEPPAHDKWELTERIKSDFKQGAGIGFRNLWRALDRAVAELAEEQLSPEGTGPQRLSRLFPIGGIGGGVPDDKKFRVDRLKAFFDNGVWRFSGRVMRKDDLENPWNFKISVWLDAETGLGDRVPIKILEAENSTIRIDGQLATCEVAGEYDQITFNGETEQITREESGVNPRRTRIRLEVRPYGGGAQ
jgi:hypothetical protein